MLGDIEDKYKQLNTETESKFATSFWHLLRHAAQAVLGRRQAFLWNLACLTQNLLKNLSAFLIRTQYKND